jgi:hypothetical protein
MKLSDLNIHDIGVTIQVGGALYTDENRAYFLPFPGESIEGKEVVVVDMDTDDWERFIQQTDRVEIVATVMDEHGKVGKTIIRKSARQISQHVSWTVFRRDHCRCRYCGANDVPLTVDHLVLWEEGGPSTEANLVAACKKCNRTRGNQPYDQWMNSGYYRKVSRNLPPMMQEANERLTGTLADIPRHPLKGVRKR